MLRRAVVRLLGAVHGRGRHAERPHAVGGGRHYWRCIIFFSLPSRQREKKCAPRHPSECPSAPASAYAPMARLPSERSGVFFWYGPFGRQLDRGGGPEPRKEGGGARTRAVACPRGAHVTPLSAAMPPPPPRYTDQHHDENEERQHHPSHTDFRPSTFAVGHHSGGSLAARRPPRVGRTP